MSSAAAPEGDQPRDRYRFDVLWRLAVLIRPYRGRFWIAVAMLLGASGLTLVYPQAAKYAIDVGMGARTTGDLDLIVLGVVGLFVLSAVFVWMRHYSLSWLGERVVTDMRRLVFARILRLSLAWFHERQSGELVGRLASDVTLIQNLIGNELWIGMRNVVGILGSLTMLLIIDVKLTLMMLAMVPPIVLAAIWFGRKIRRLAGSVHSELAQVSGHVQESVAAVATVQAFVREDHETERYRVGVEGAFKSTLNMARWRASFLASATTAGYIGVAAVMWLGGRALINNELTPGELTSFFLYTFIIAGAIADLATVWAELQRAAGATDRLFSVIDTIPDITSPVHPIPLPAGEGTVRFDNVRFAYPSRPDEHVLCDFDLTISPGEVIAVVGPSGAGKSTILALLYRFYDVDAGRVLFEGVDVRELSLEELRRSLAIVSQDPILFSGTIRDNIAYGRIGAARDEIEAAARDAHAHDFITRFADGYDTLIGERGAKLSGGQKQRIALARALIANPRVLMLDEATSNLDAESEAAVQAALARIMVGRTTIIVAHRLSTVRDADRILVIDGARIAEQGSHMELMTRSGTYRRLVEHQLVATRVAS